MPSLAIGTAKGPGPNPHEFLFISPDEARHCKVGEFVYYVLDDAGVERDVLGRVVKRAPVRLFPDSFMASPDVSPAEIAAAVGYVDDENELFEITVAVMGYFDPGLNSFVNPRVLPRSGSRVYLAPDDLLAGVLSKRRAGEAGSAQVGWLLSRKTGEVGVVLDVNELTSTHFSIIAGTGSGKSYLAGVTVEELMMPANKAAVLIADPHGEYDTLIEMQNDPRFVARGYRPRVKVFKPHQVKVRMSSLRLDDLRYLLNSLGERSEWILNESFRRMQRRGGSAYDGGWTLTDLYNAIADFGDEHGGEDGEYSSSIHALRWRLERRFDHSPTFDDTKHLDLAQLFQPGQCTVLQLNEISQQDQQVVVATLLRRLLHARMETERGSAVEGDETYLPYPAFVLLEEAHHFAPASADVVSSGIVKQVLSEGRKFGVGMGLISQRPGKLDADALSQCMTHFIMRIVNPVDQNSIAGAVESVGRDLLDELSSLSKGQVVIAGSALNTPVLCQTRTRFTSHGGVSVDAVAAWDRYFADGPNGNGANGGVVASFRGGKSKLFHDEP
jgi:DNA helicase HerA-like ATPase